MNSGLNSNFLQVIRVMSVLLGLVLHGVLVKHNSGGKIVLLQISVDDLYLVAGMNPVMPVVNCTVSAWMHRTLHLCFNYGKSPSGYLFSMTICCLHLLHFIRQLVYFCLSIQGMGYVCRSLLSSKLSWEDDRIMRALVM